MPTDYEVNEHKYCVASFDTEDRPRPMRELHFAYKVFLPQGRYKEAHWPAFASIGPSISSSGLP